MVKDNGGAIAQKGFNYQTSVICLVAIRNYEKSNFTIYVETDDDFEVLYDKNNHAYIQVKGTKRVGINTLLKGKEGKSILEKNLSSGEDDSLYKVVVYNFNETDKKEMQEQTKEEELFYNSWLFSEKQKRRIIDRIGNDLGVRTDNFAIIITDFKNDFRSANTYLKGEMVNQKISVSDNRDEIILSELRTLITQRAEKEIRTDKDKSLKKITTEDLSRIFQKEKSKESFDKELESLNITSYKKKKIKNQELKIPLYYYSHKEIIVNWLKENEYRLVEEDLQSLISDLFKIEQIKHLCEDTRYAICISAYCDVLEGVFDE